MNQWMHEYVPWNYTKSFVYISETRSDSVRKHWCSKIDIYI